MSSVVPTFQAETLPTRGAVKICGVTQREQAMAIAEMGADFLGLNFWPQSKRYLRPEAASAWAAQVPRTTTLVGLFVNASSDDIRRTADALGLTHVQLHGDEPPEFCADLAASNYHVIKAIQVRDESSLDAIARFPVQDILLDAYHPGLRGGIGEAFPWELAAKFKKRYQERRLWLAGGLTPDNVAVAVHGVGPYAVDVASGVEDAMPGIKNLDKVRRFIEGAGRMTKPMPGVHN
jgi:phosphoribosylanthranilate isomerase